MSANLTAVPTPAAEPTLADEIVAFLNRFIVFPDPRQADAVALWIIHTHAFDAAYATPYLYVNSAEKQSGKTRVIEVVKSLVRNSMDGADMTAAAMYRVINDRQPTIFIDEVDTIFTGAANETLRNFLNSGYKHGGKTLRFTGKETEEFSTFCPKLLAGIDNGAMPDTIADRCVKITLKRKRDGETVERWLWRKVEADAMALQGKIREWTAHNMEPLADAEPTVIDEISDRAFEISEPLLAIADRLPGWHQRGRDAVTFLLRGETQALSIQAQVLKAARDFMDAHNVDRVPSAALAELTGMNGKQVSAHLAKYEIRPGTRRIGGTPTKCYLRVDMQDAFDRYLPAE